MGGALAVVRAQHPPGGLRGARLRLLLAAGKVEILDALGFGAHARHDSSNFAWFAQRYPDFFYIDRVAVASRRRGGGVGRALYADVQSYAELRYPQIACEVFLQPGTDHALLFHGSFGFREVGQHVGGNGLRADEIARTHHTQLNLRPGAQGLGLCIRVRLEGAH